MVYLKVFNTAIPANWAGSVVTDFSKLPNLHPKFQPPAKSSTPFSKLNELSFIHILSVQIIIKNSWKTILKRKPNNIKYKYVFDYGEDFSQPLYFHFNRL